MNEGLSTPTITVIGVGAEGWEGLTESVRRRVRDADTVLGGWRLLASLPDSDQVRREWPSPLRAGLREMLAESSGTVVALASGDPLLSGVGTTLVEIFGAEQVEILPAVSSVTLARARMRWSAESATVVSLVGRSVDLLRRELAPGRRVLVLSADALTPAAIAAILIDEGYGDSVMTALGELGSAMESRTSGTAHTWATDGLTAPQLHVLAVELAGPAIGAWVAGLPDALFEHDGQITKRDVRASALARLAPRPGELLWDLGAGAGSVAIEWMRAHPDCMAVAVERSPDRCRRIQHNAERLGVPGIDVVQGEMVAALESLAEPDAIFIGGGATNAGLIAKCLAALQPGGRIVAHGVTLETDAVLADAHRQYGGELTRISVEHVDSIGTFRGWSPARAVTQWSLQV